MAIRLASNLLKSRHGIYYFRLVFPKHLKSPKSELRLSLMTHSQARAKQQAIFLKMAVIPYLANLSIMTNKEHELLKQKLKSLAEHWEEEGDKLMLRGLKLFDLEINEVEVNGEEDSKHFFDAMKNYVQGENRPLQVSENISISISEASELYYKFLSEKGKKIKNKTLEEKKHSLNDFQEILYNKELNTLTEADVVAYRDTLLNLPSNRRKKKIYRELDIFEAAAIEKPDSDLVAVETVRNNMMRVSSFINWAVDRNYLDYNCLTDFVPESEVIKNDQRLSLNEADLTELFSSDELYTFKTEDVTTYTYWSMWVALYTGMRLEEVCRLRVEDVLLDCEVPCFYVRPYVDEHLKVTLYLKTINSERTIPIHPMLYKSGFVDYVKAMKKNGFYRVFPELALLRDGFGGRVSKWFARFKLRTLTCELVNKKTFHSFRHTFVNKLYDQGYPDDVIEHLVGHTSNISKTTLRRNYLDTPALKKKLKIIKTISFPCDSKVTEMKKVSKEIAKAADNYISKNPKDLQPTFMGGEPVL